MVKNGSERIPEPNNKTQDPNNKKQDPNKVQIRNLNSSSLLDLTHEDAILFYFFIYLVLEIWFL